MQPDLSISSEWTLEPKAARRAFDLIRDEGLDVWGYCGNETVIGDFAGVLKRAAKVVGVSDDHDLVQRCESDLRERAWRRWFHPRSQPYYVDVTHSEANKGAVDHLSRMLAIPTDQIATIGDSPQRRADVSQKRAQHRHGHASEEVKRQADAVNGFVQQPGLCQGDRALHTGDDAALRPTAE